MADEPLTIRGINWRETFPFTNLFRAFRVAIHPSKLVLALAALLLLYLGGQLLDGLWVIADKAVPGEVAAFEAAQTGPNPEAHFNEYRRVARQKIEDEYADKLQRYKVISDRDSAVKAAKNGEALGRLKDAIVKEQDSAKATAAATRDAAVKEAKKLKGDAQDAAQKAAEAQYNATVRAIYSGAAIEYRSAKSIKNEGLSDDFFAYEASQVSSVVRGVRDWNWFGEEHYEPWSFGSTAKSINDDASSPTIGYGSAGVIQSVIRFLTVGPLWLFTQHTFYAILIGAFFLVVWAIFGGAISRIAAVHVARDEKMSIRSALKFSISKSLSFLFAPIIPLIIVGAVGLLVLVGSLLGNIPFLGPIFIGVTFFLALAAGFVMALVLLGLLGGFNLMYPTIAVEGSDSFDAISRSFSYLYARPWRLAFYTVVSVVYGALTYLFVRLFIYLILVLTHKFVGAGIFLSSPSTEPLFSAMWPSPTNAARLTYEPNWLSLGIGDHVGATLIYLWVSLVIAMLGAFAISFYFSANTIIYYLMRREVDATEMDDVYLEQVDDEFMEPAAPFTPADSTLIDAPPPPT